MQVQYRGHDNLLWKINYAKLYQEQFADLELMNSKHLAYKTGSNVDQMFMLRKNSCERTKRLELE